MSFNFSCLNDSKVSDEDVLEKVKEFIESNPTKLNEIYNYYAIVINYFGTLLHFSCVWNRPKVVSYLLSKNADVTICFDSYGRKNGLTAKQIAKKQGYRNIVTLFEQYEWEQAEREHEISNPIEGQVQEKPVAALRSTTQPKPVPAVKPSPNSQPVTYSTIKAKILYNEKKAILNLTFSNLSDLQEQIKNRLNIIGNFRIEYLDKDFGEFAELFEITELKDLVELQIFPEQDNSLDSQHKGSSPFFQERGNRCEPPTARFSPGKRFLEIIPKVLSTPTSVIDGLEKYAKDQKLSLMIIQKFKDKIEDFSETNNPETAFSMALCWLYTSESWVYPHVNTQLRDDSSTMVLLAPFMKALIGSYKNFDENGTNTHTRVTGCQRVTGCHSVPQDIGQEDPNTNPTVVYRRTKLTKKDLDFYKPNLHFVWSAFISTSIEFNPSGEFGNILFEITIPEIFRKYAICLENVSAFPTEREVLMLPNIAYRVVSIENNPEKYPNTTCVIKVNVEYVCMVV